MEKIGLVSTEYSKKILTLRSDGVVTLFVME